MIPTARLAPKGTTALVRDCLVWATAQENLSKMELELTRSGQLHRWTWANLNAPRIDDLSAKRKSWRKSSFIGGAGGSYPIGFNARRESFRRHTIADISQRRLVHLSRG
jgi:hypothetical protein